MNRKSIPLAADKSVHCINERQMNMAMDLLENDPQSAPRIQYFLRQVEEACTRNEQAALAFAIIQKLKAVQPAQHH